MYEYVIDPEEAILVAHHAREPSDERWVRNACAAVCALEKAPGRPELPKLFLLSVDADAPHPDAEGRRAIVRSARSMVSPVVFAFVTTSAIARATANILRVLVPQKMGQRSGAFATIASAVAWLDALRPDAKETLFALSARLHVNHRRVA